MTMATLRPNADYSTTATVIGSSANAATSDNSDGTYIQIGYPYFTMLQFDAFSFVAGSVIKNLTLRARTARSAVGNNSSQYQIVDDRTEVPFPEFGPLEGSIFTSHTTPATVTIMGAYSSESAEWTDDYVDHVMVAVRDEGTVPGKLHLYELYMDVVYVVKPILTVDGPTGTITHNLPEIEWTNTVDSDGGSVLSQEIKIFDSATYGAGGFDPNTSTPVAETTLSDETESWTVDEPLPDGIYKAYVRCAQIPIADYHWSDWTAGAAFTVDVPDPNSPIWYSITESDEQGYIGLKLTEDNDGDVPADRFEIQRSYDGETWVPIRTLLGADGYTIVDAGTAELWDHEVSNSIPVYYRARGISDDEAASSASPWVTTGPHSWSSSAIWLKHPNRPALNAHNPEGGIVRSFPRQSRDSGASVKRPLGAKYPIVTRDTQRIADSGELVVMTEDATQRAVIDDLLDSGDVLLLQFPPEADEPDRYIAPIGSHDRERIIDKQSVPLRDETIPWQEVAEPDGPVIEWFDTPSS